MSELGTRLIEILGRSRTRARFVPELTRQSAAPQAEVEQAISDLEADGRVLMREQYCPDPHLEGVDLRIAALIQRDESGDAVATANDSIEATWQRWLGDYLANHRCT